MKIKRLLELDFFLFFSAVLMTCFGILFIYSSGITSEGFLVSNEYVKQIIWACTGIVIALIIALFDYRRIYDFSFYIYLGTLALLLYTVFFGRLVNGARSWIGIGSFGIQPSEFAKIATILFLARFLDTSKRSHNDFRRFLISCIIVIVPVGITMLQPDLGTALVFIPILLVMTFIAGIRMRYVLYAFSFITITAILMILPLWQAFILGGTLPFLMFLENGSVIMVLSLAFTLIALIALFGYRYTKKRYFYWICYLSSIFIFSLLSSFLSHKVLKDYQLMRLIVFLDPYVDPQGSGWNIIQSITAIGSGGLTGRGFLNGTQSHYRFLPQQSTDFIFSIFSEEWGFIGGLLLFALVLIILLRLIRIMTTTSDPYAAYIIAGISAIFSFHFLINVGMTMGIMPITGIPLVFMSYGGSSLLSSMIAIGLSLSIYIRRYEH